MKKGFLIFIVVFLFFVVGTIIFSQYKNILRYKEGSWTIADVLKLRVPPKELQIVAPSPIPTPTPTPKPLTFAEMNYLYGPCVYLPTLIYHHIEDMSLAKKNNQTGLAVGTDIFDKQMQYLKDKNYQTVGVSELINFFDNGVGIPRKSVILSFDDGYADFALNALPILKKYGFKAITFVPTGLIGNFNYMSWEQVVDAAGQNMYIANHTWSHKNMDQPNEAIEKEILTADIQLSEHGLNLSKVFAYPYGTVSGYSQAYLQKLGYKLAFTTRPGSFLCKKQRLNLPRVRVGNSSLSIYGL
jgi:peptidoglycan/xylan/chitin deacetylase (PgdA/CDA1 family)